MRPDYYAILEVSRTASPEEIKSSFRRLAMKFHPDKNPGFEDKFRSVLEAYDVLVDPEKKRKYDSGRYYFEHYRKSAPAKTSKNKQKDYSFTDEQFWERQEFAKKYREQHRQKQAEETASLPSYSDFKYIMISIPVAVALLFLVINYIKKEDIKNYDPAHAHKSAAKPVPEKAGAKKDQDSVAQVTADKAMQNMYISPWNKVFGAPVFDTTSAKTLRIENRSGVDVVVCLYDEQKKKVIRNNYIVNGYYLLMDFLPAGKFHLKVIYGKDWNAANQTTDFSYEGMFDTVLAYARFNSAKEKISIAKPDLKKADTITRVLPPVNETKPSQRLDNHRFFYE